MTWEITESPLGGPEMFVPYEDNHLFHFFIEMAELFKAPNLVYLHASIGDEHGSVGIFPRDGGDKNTVYPLARREMEDLRAGFLRFKDEVAKADATRKRT